MRTKRRLLAIVGFLGLSWIGCGPPAYYPPPAAQAPPAPPPPPVPSTWRQEFPGAARDLNLWAQSDPGAAQMLFNWDQQQPDRSQEFTSWLVVNRNVQPDAFGSVHPDWSMPGDLFGNHPQAAARFVDWVRHHPRAAKRLATYPGGLAWVSRHMGGPPAAVRAAPPAASPAEGQGDYEDDRGDR